MKKRSLYISPLFNTFPFWAFESNAHMDSFLTRLAILPAVFHLVFILPAELYSNSHNGCYGDCWLLMDLDTFFRYI